MADRNNLKEWVVEALKANGGSGTIVKVCKFIWTKYENNLKMSGNLFYTWQYDVRWAAKILRDEGRMKPAKTSPKGLWELEQ